MRTPISWRSVAVLALAATAALGACGGARPGASNGTRDSAGVVPWSVTLRGHRVLAVDARGAVTLGGEPFGRLEAGELVTRTGLRARLHPDGSIEQPGVDMLARIDGSRATVRGATLFEIDASSTLVLRGPSGAELARLPFRGLVDGMRRTALFVVLVVLGAEQAERDRRARDFEPISP